jgi:hypothetical protein
MDGAKKEYANKEDYMEFGFFVKRFMQYAFTDQKVVIEQIKSLKKSSLGLSPLGEKLVPCEESKTNSTTTPPKAEEMMMKVTAVSVQAPTDAKAGETQEKKSETTADEGKKGEAPANIDAPKV